MKTTLLALAALAPAALAGTYTEPVNPYSLELGVSYNFAARDLVRTNDANGPKVDTLGVDLTGVYTVNDNSSFNLRFGFATGSDDKGNGEFGNDVRVNNFYLMPGYRYTHRMSEHVHGFIGANIGVINESLKYKYTTPLETRRYHGSEYGFAYSAEAGLKFYLTQNFDLFLAYQFFGSTAEPGLNSIEGSNTRSQLYHCIRGGVSFDF
ncbi:MAG: outer membrane beta-barrel protein [Akkermansiaceae bacterium]|nr:outer membrane beta-barrel protein [Akkermansiaceae bacterium]